MDVFRWERDWAEVEVGAISGEWGVSQVMRKLATQREMGIRIFIS